MRASKIASHKAALAQRESRIRRRKSLQYTLTGLLLIGLGIGGALGATALGWTQELGLPVTVGSALISVAVGGALLLLAPGTSSTSVDRYSSQARQLAQMSRSIRRS